jgi:16S rRNA (guanine527-N7)-methyltransferase
VKALGLVNVNVITARAEEYARGNGREKYDSALSRAVAPLNVLIEYLLPFLKVGGKALAWKGPSASTEITAAARACRQLGGGEMKPHGYLLPDRKDFFIIEIQKIRQTPSSFPRKTGKPSSDPLI